MSMLVETTPSAPSWMRSASTWLPSSSASPPLADGSTAPAPADDLADLRDFAAGLLATLPPTWRAECRAWPEVWRARWASLAEAGEAEGLTTREANVLAYDVFVDQVRDEVGITVVSPARDSFVGWSPTQEPVILAPTRSASKRGPKDRTTPTLILA